MTCFHCTNGKCDCITCQGHCVACKGIAKWNKLRTVIKDIDIRERQYWVLKRPEAPAHPQRRLILEEQFDNAAGIGRRSA